jgi:HSP20 family protein
MTLLRYEPWNTLHQLHREIDQIFGDGVEAPAANGERAADWAPAVDVHEEPQQFVLRADLPGVATQDINVTAEKGVLTIRGERRAEPREERKGFARIERAHGSFLRRFTLPENVRTDDIRAQHRNGVLEVILPKVRAPEPRRVSIETH